MKRTGLAALLLLFAASRLFAADPTPPTFCAEWVEQSKGGYERLTLFVDRSLVWKRHSGGAEQLKRQRLAPDEAKFYCDYFRGDDIWFAAEDLRSGMTGDLVKQSVVTLARADGTRKVVRFDELSGLTPETAALRSSLAGLKGLFTAPLAPPSRFSADNLPPGTVLKRFDGVLFRVKTIEVQKGVVELEGVSEPYSEFRKIEELRFLFAAPEGR